MLGKVGVGEVIHGAQRTRLLQRRAGGWSRRLQWHGKRLPQCQKCRQRWMLSYMISYAEGL
ncbi:hypothetical protein QWZ03_10405 [Chitinimonas viridis]|uniref:Uncharacterized protein n=1 Tax=Chitinimonas viridis TaxID=664880 RepID=A0ABT8B4J3_9NEIS|nr:hypothetical protein [Chitinimonas viridis]MDN3577178.1 hypothetical protein [Chitinimonas viridis]